MNTIKELVKKYDTDKTLSGYTSTYESLFSPIKDKATCILEIGLGTLDPSIPSSFVGNGRLFEHYKQGGSLRVWRDYFLNADVYGIDIAEDCMFEEERITTFLFDSSNDDDCKKNLNNLKFDVIIDDGNHDPKYQIKTFRNLFSQLKFNGFYIIEDIGGYSGNEDLLVDYLEEFNELTNGHEVINKGNHIVIQKIKNPIKVINRDLTIVTGLWNISRTGRDFDHYVHHFNNFLDIDANLFIFIPKEYEHLVWAKRSRSNTFVKTYELDDIKNLYSPFWEKTQEIRKSDKWLNITGEGGWLKNSPQAVNEWYNPIVQSKMFMLNDVTIWNPFNTNNFIWLDAGITNTVYEKYFTDNKILDKINQYLDPFLFLSYPYESAGEIHGFNFEDINRYAGSKVEYVCRGGLFGGTKQAINEASGIYYSLLDRSLSEGLMGTEESIFAIMSYIKPEMFRRYSLDDNGLVIKFIQALDEDNVLLEPVPESRVKYIESNKTSDDFKTSVYILTFNFSEQVEHTIKTYLKHDKWLTSTRNILIDNSTNDEAREANKVICEKYNFEHIITGKNGGICGGRQLAAEHFQESDSDYYVFLEDDMQLHEEGNGYCRNGFRQYIPNLYDVIHRIMNKSNLDYLKLSFTEVFMDNHLQVSWYNVPQHIRTEFWPDYDRLPTTGLDPNCPRTDFKKIESIDGVSYITGDVYYANWPMIVGKEGNRKMFLETTWAHPYEQTWMSYIFQETKKGNIKPGILLASPINHNRFMHYKAEDRREN